MNARTPLPIVVLISGRGSNLRAIVNAMAAGALPVEMRAVISDRPDAAGLAFARECGIPAVCLAPREFTDRAAYDLALAMCIDAYAPGLLVLAGFMRILSTGFVERYAGCMLNIHPSLLPRHRGLHTHRRALEAGDLEHGASVHFVTAELDGGPVILQGRVRVERGDDEATLATRVRSIEHRILPLAIAWFAEARLRCADGSAWLDGRKLEAPVRVEEPDHAPATATA